MISLRLPSCAVACLALAPALSSAEIESHIGSPDDLLWAGTRANPEQIGPGIRHHHLHDTTLNFEVEGSAGVESRYVSEGRDNLPGEGGIGWGSLTGHLHVLGGSIFGEILGLAGWEASYQELNLSAGYEFESGPLTLGAFVTHLWFPSDHETDFEMGFSAGLVLECGVGFATDGAWSVEAEGWFGEAELFYEFSAGELATLTPAVFLGVNQGYVPREHDGFNHLGFRLEGTLVLRDWLEASLHASFSEPLSKESGESLRDLFWFGGALTTTF